MTRARGLPLALIVAALTVAADRVTKIWAENALVAGACRPGDGCIELVGSLRLHLVFNRGAAFSTGTRLGPLFGVVAAVMTAVLLRLAAAAPDRVRTVLFALIAGGAVGNLIDRIVRAEDGLLSGAVVDFVDVQWWPVFNVADAAVVIGVLAFVAHSLLHPDRAGSGRPTPDAGSDVVADAAAGPYPVPGAHAAPDPDGPAAPEPEAHGGEVRPQGANGSARERVPEAGG